jgi:ABC-type dipeptide/oligopeptide/nickel transport system permease component/ABC-type transport system substrate-binding protein
MASFGEVKRLLPILRFLRNAFLTGLSLLAFIAFWAWLLTPEVLREEPEFDPEKIAEAEALRNVRVDTENPLTVYREVDYGAGPDASWWPREEAPALAELTREGVFPPVAQRVGPEPVVFEGVEGNGQYGGTWIYYIANDSQLFQVYPHRLSYAFLVRWSHYGYPIVPHIAREWEVNADGTEYTFHLRRGIRWSDGHPFTAADILYWYEHEVMDPAVMTQVPEILRVKGEVGTVEKIDTHTVRFKFPIPNGLFLERLASFPGWEICDRPAHYLRRFHPTIGDPGVIRTVMEAASLQRERQVYFHVRNIRNPELPSLRPWIIRTAKNTLPVTFVRNPYYYVVDTEGRQLPYIDRLYFDAKSPDLLAVDAMQGSITLQTSGVEVSQYSLLMDNKDRSGIDLKHWMMGERSIFLIQPNQNRRIEPDDPASANKHDLLREPEFRKALSLALNRDNIIRAEYNGLAEPAQVAPPPDSPFYEPELYHAYTEYDPQRANRMLDELGLDQRDREGYRTFADGTRMHFFLNVVGRTGGGAAQTVTDYWSDVGVRVSPRERSGNLYRVQTDARLHDFNVWSGNGEFMPLLEPRMFVPSSTYSDWARGYAIWYLRGGLYQELDTEENPGAIEPPAGSVYRRTMEVYDSTKTALSLDDQVAIFRENLLHAADNLWTISISNSPPRIVPIKDTVRNVPDRAVYSWDFISPGNTGIETYYFAENNDSPGAIAQTIQELRVITPLKTVPDETGQLRTGFDIGKLARNLILLVAALLLVLAGVRHPYIGRRLVIMVPTLFIISVISFTIIQLPPGDYVTFRIMQLEESGEKADEQEIEQLTEMFHLEAGPVEKYLRWAGVYWFFSYKTEDKGLLQGFMGRSMETKGVVNVIIGERVMLTFFISLGTVLFTWAVALPIGIYSAVRQYSIGDYISSVIGFLGMCIPNFLLAVLLMYGAWELMGIRVTGLFSPEYATQPEWSWGKVMDLLGHIWIPIVVIGTGGTAGMIRVMRGNLLDELNKPYVTTARAKGVRPFRLLMKYPVRLALNPFISGIGGIFPALLSGGAIVAVVLSLPTVGPLMLNSLLSQDMYMAGSMLMVFSLLGVMGTLVSDLLLLWLDPRIRMEGGSR